MSWLPLLENNTWFALIWAAVLVLCAYGIDALARRAARSLEGDRRGDFVYHEDHDAWLCPEDQWLWPDSFDPENRIMRYRGSPSVCNSCPVKDTCTTSNSGREIQRQVDPWPASESARFHRGIACAIAVMAVVWPLATILSNPPTADMVLLGGMTILVVLSTLPLWAHFRRSPADPTGVLVRNADDHVVDVAEDAADFIRRRTTYRSDRTKAAPGAREENK